jgi:hypothetical protein
MELNGPGMKGFAGKNEMGSDLPTMRQKFWITLVICLVWCINMGLYKTIDYLRQQIQALE